MDADADFLLARDHFVMNFGGDRSCPVWWRQPFVLMPISLHLDAEDFQAPDGTTVLAEEVGTDSGSFIFLPLTDDLPSTLQDQITDLLCENNGANGASLAIPA